MIIFFLNSCEQKNFPPELIGQWKTKHGYVEKGIPDYLELIQQGYDDWDLDAEPLVQIERAAREAIERRTR